MAFAVAIFTGLIFLLIVNALTPETKTKTSEEEFGEAVTKYLAEQKKKQEDKKGKP